MVLFLTIVLVLSSLGMAVILWLKRYEMRSGHVFAVGMRPRLRGFFARSLFWVERVLPALAAWGTRRMWEWGRASVRAGAAWSLITLEHGLERSLKALRQATAQVPAQGTEASPFLREVVEHKKKLQEGREE